MIVVVITVTTSSVLGRACENRSETASARATGFPVTG
jgi:hypothetical protein